MQGQIDRFLKWGVGALCRNKKILGFRWWSKKVEIMLEIVSFGQNVSGSIFSFSRFLSIKSYHFFKIY